MANNKISHLRDRLFEALENLDEPKPNYDKINATVSITNAIINTVKTELNYAKITGQTKGSDSFFSENRELPSAEKVHQMRESVEGTLE